jgi:hypothetical protein
VVFSFRYYARAIFANTSRSLWHRESQNRGKWKIIDFTYSIYRGGLLMAGRVSCCCHRLSGRSFLGAWLRITADGWHRLMV